MNIKKNVQVVSLVLSEFGNSLNYMKLLKILYFINRQSLEENAYEIIDDTYANMPHGIVLSSTYDLIRSNFKDKVIQGYWDSFFITQNTFDLVARTSVVPIGELSRYEKRVIRENVEKYRNHTQWQLSELHHSKAVCPEWKDPHGSSFSLPKNTILSCLGYNDEQILVIEEEEKIYKAEERFFKSLCEA